MRRLMCGLLLLVGCRFDSAIAVHYHAAPDQDQVIYRYPPASQPATSRPAGGEQRPVDILKEFLP